MTNFLSRDPAATKILSDELEKKIDSVNKAMVDTRNETERLVGAKNSLEVEIRSLEEKKKGLGEEVKVLGEEQKLLLSALDSLEKSVKTSKESLAELTRELVDLKQANEEEKKLLLAEKEDVKKRKEDLSGQEAVLRTVAKGLEAKEKQLDVYAERVKKLLDSVRPE